MGKKSYSQVVKAHNAQMAVNRKNPAYAPNYRAPSIRRENKANHAFHAAISKGNTFDQAMKVSGEIARVEYGKQLAAKEAKCVIQAAKINKGITAHMDAFAAGRKAGKTYGGAMRMANRAQKEVMKGGGGEQHRDSEGKWD